MRETRDVEAAGSHLCADGDAHAAVSYRRAHEAPRRKVAGFDLDGTLVESTQLAFVATNEVR